MSRYTTIPITHALAQKIEAWVEAGYYLNIPDFVRQSVREHLERLQRGNTQ